MSIGLIEHPRELERFIENVLENRKVLPKDVAPGIAPPAGSILAYGGTTAPAGYLLCDGSEKPVATYPVLDAVLGTTFGARTDGAGGAGTTHFRLPDARGRVLAMPGGSIAALGNAGGAATHTLSAAEMPSHTHNRNITPGGSQSNNSGPDGFMWHDTGVGGYLTSSSGSDAAHNNVQPYLSANCIVKT